MKRINIVIDDPEKERILAEKILRTKYLQGQNNPNYSAYARALLLGEIKDELTIPQQDSLIQLLTDAKECGHYESVELLGRWILNKENLCLSQVHSKIIESLVNSSKLPFLDLIEKLISRKQPFRISYNNSSGEDEQFICTYGHIESIERHRYLVAKVTEASKAPPHPDLGFNRCFRLDRILAVSQFDSYSWESLPTVEVVFHLYGAWTKTYEPKKGDISDQPVWIVPPGGDHDPIREIRRRVSSVFWFLREIERYEAVRIIAPQEVKEKHFNKLKEKLALYGEK